MVWLNLSRGLAPTRLIQSDRGYLVRIVSFGEEILYSFRFEIPIEMFAVPPEWFDPKTGEQIYFGEDELTEEAFSDVLFSLVMPYFLQAKAIEFYDPYDNLLLFINISEYQLCQDDLENCEDILIRYHQQEIEQLENVPGFGEEIQIRQDKIEELRKTKIFKEEIESMRTAKKSEEREKIKWGNILIALGSFILFAFVIYIIWEKVFSKKKLI